MKGFSLEQLDYLFAENTPTLKFSKIKFADEILADGQGKSKDGFKQEDADNEHLESGEKR